MDFEKFINLLQELILKADLIMGKLDEAIELLLAFEQRKRDE